ncbi:MAG: biotin--[acetyl-CoA-carboxylase] ligase [Gemmatimonadales bacterium]
MLHFIPSTESTQDDLHDRAAAGAPEGTAVVAGMQTVGRGSRGRRWDSPAGGLWMSVLCRPATEPALEVLSLRVALAVCGTLDRIFPGLPLLLKWPNDLLLNDRKLGGILCEARWQGASVGWVVVGLGLNLTNPISAALAAQAINLEVVVPSPTPAMLAPLMADSIVCASRLGGMLSDAEIEAYRRRDWLHGRQLVEPAVGRAEGITSRGELQVADPSGSVSLRRTGTVILRTNSR